jgi:cardiolipin synthase
MSFADKLSILRILLIPLFVSLLFYFNQERLYLRYIVLVVFVIAVLSDFLDGLVARIKKEKSKIGQVVDPLADKLLLLAAFISLYALRNALPLKHQLPLSMVLVVVSRDLVILLGVGILYFLKIEISISPTILGKLTTFFQMFTILALLTDFFLFPLIWKIALIFTLISGIDYFLMGVKAINAKNNPSSV